MELNIQELKERIDQISVLRGMCTVMEDFYLEILAGKEEEEKLIQEGLHIFNEI